MLFTIFSADILPAALPPYARRAALLLMPPFSIFAAGCRRYAIAIRQALFDAATLPRCRFIDITR
jgi:hypothetical protein